MIKILCAAIYVKNNLTYSHQPNNIVNGFVICGYRHSNCYATLKIVGFKTFDIVEGFLTSDNRFVDRIEGAIIANSSKQTESAKFLFSENLY